MHKILTIFLVALFITSAHSYFFNIEHFLKPVTDPNAKIFGSAIGHDSRRNFDFIIPIDDRGKQNLRINDQVEKDLYRALGVPEDVVINRILPVHTKVKANV